MSTRAAHGYDVVVVGSGFGGSVTALRLSEKGYRVAVLEAGARFADADFAKNSWQLRRFLFAPAAGCFGIQRIDVLRNVLVLSGAGVGGGSLNYANTLYQPPPQFFADPHWAAITDWADELAPHYDQARRMLGVTMAEADTPADDVMRAVATEMGVADTFTAAPVGVFLGPPRRRVPDPYFGGAGPERTGCRRCGECMTGCRHGAKNTLVKNYLHLAELAGADIHPLTTVEDLRPPTAPGGDWTVVARSTPVVGRRRTSFTAPQVVIACSALGTARLLHRLKRSSLPNLSDRLGELTRTNSESLLGAVAGDRGVDYTEGVAITSSFHPDANTHIEPVRYGRGSNAMALLATALTDGDTGRARWREWAAAVRAGGLRGIYDRKHWSERTVIALVMQNLDNSLTTYGARRFGRWRLTSRQGIGAPNPSWIPAANTAARIMAKVMAGRAAGTIGEPLDMPMTAHFLGGCPMGESAATGVIDAYHRVHNYPGLSVIDGSCVTANLGVNPALTITALAERACALMPNHACPDPRPAPGQAYARIAPVRPGAPAVPADAPGALRW